MTPEQATELCKSVESIRFVLCLLTGIMFAWQTVWVFKWVKSWDCLK